MFIKIFGELSKHDAAVAGGKGASLGEMTRAGIPVPPGFVVLAGAFERFLEETDLSVEVDAILHTVNHKEMHTVENASERIQSLILGAEMPKDIAAEIKKEFKKLGAKYVAVRSSATAEDSASAAWAGQLDSFLNTAEKNLLKNVQRCWASLFTPRAIFYRFEKGLHELKIGVAVVVQKMVESEVAGIAFSVHPVTEDRNQLIIEAGFGLGEAIVSGQITPDSYVVEKNPRRIVDKNISVQDYSLIRANKRIDGKGTEGGGVGNARVELSKEKGTRQKLSDAQILELAELILKIEAHYGFPCDVEWAVEKGKLYILQSRPITTLRNQMKSGDSTVYDFVKNKEVAERLASSSDWYNKSYSGYFIGIYEQGRAIGHESSVNEFAPRYGFVFANHEKKDHWDWFWDNEELRTKRKELLAAVLKNSLLIDSICKEGERQQAIFFSYADSIASIRIAELPNEKLKSVFVRLHKTLMETCQWAYTVDTFLSDDREDWLVSFIKKYLGSGATSEVIETLTLPVFPSFVSEAELLFLRIVSALKHSQEDKAKQYALEYTTRYFWIRTNYKEYGRVSARGIFQNAREFQVRHKSEDIDELIRLEERRSAENKKRKEELYRKLHIPSELHTIIRISELFTHFQDRRKEKVLRMNTLFYEFVAEAEKRLGIEHPLGFYLTAEELFGMFDGVTPDWSEIKSRYKDGFLTVFYDETYAIIPAVAYKAKRIESNFFRDNGAISEIGGSVAYKGVVKGIVRVCKSFSDIRAFQEGEILIANQTTPEYVPALKRAAAFVTDQGGITSHAAIVSRELKKPCIIGTKIATKVLKDGDMVEVDADKGVVKIIKKA